MDFHSVLIGSVIPVKNKFLTNPHKLGQEVMKSQFRDIGKLTRVEFLHLSYKNKFVCMFTSQ